MKEPKDMVSTVSDGWCNEVVSNKLSEMATMTEGFESSVEAEVLPLVPHLRHWRELLLPQRYTTLIHSSSIVGKGEE